MAIFLISKVTHTVCYNTTSLQPGRNRPLFGPHRTLGQNFIDPFSSSALIDCITLALEEERSSSSYSKRAFLVELSLLCNGLFFAQRTACLESQ
jgi:hypothetical protein